MKIRTIPFPSQTQRVQTTRQSWNKNPAGYEKHQRLLLQLIQYLEAHGLDVELPEERGGWDLGRDLTVDGIVLDLKGISLRYEDDNAYWYSKYYQTHAHPATYTGSLTEWFVHAKGDNTADWLIARASHTLADENDCNPYYKSKDVQTLCRWAAIQKARRGLRG